MLLHPFLSGSSCPGGGYRVSAMTLENMSLGDCELSWVEVCRPSERLP